MSVKESQVRAVTKYVKNHYDRIEIKTQKGTKDAWSIWASLEDKSLQKFMTDAVEDYIARKEEPKPYDTSLFPNYKKPED